MPIEEEEEEEQEQEEGGSYSERGRTSNGRRHRQIVITGMQERRIWLLLVIWQTALYSTAL
jgi:hypothetical protein